MPSKPWESPEYDDQPAAKPWDSPEYDNEPSTPMEFTGDELKPIQAEMIGKLPGRLERAFESPDVVGEARAAAVGALPPALGAAYDVAVDAAADIPRHLSGNSQFAKVQNLLDSWRAAKEKRQGTLERSQAEHPIATLGGQMAGGMALAAPAMAALPATAGPLTQLAVSSAANRLAEKGDPISLPADVAQDLGAAGLMKGGYDLIKGGLVSAAGRLAQAPQQVTEWAADKLGGTRLGRALAGDDVRPLPEGVSPQVNALRAQQLAGEYGQEAAREMSEAINNVGGLAGQRIAALSPDERRTVADVMARLFSKRGSTVSADDLVRNWDELAPRMFLRADKDSVADLLRSVNTRDEAYLAALGSNIAMRARVVGKAGSQIAPVQDMLDASEASHNEYLVGRMTRGGQPATPGQNQGAFHVKPEDIPNPQNAQDQMALRLAKLANQGKGSIDISPEEATFNWKPGESFSGGYQFPREELGGVSKMADEAAEDALNKYRPHEVGIGLDTRDRIDRAFEATVKPGPGQPAAREDFKSIGQRMTQNLNADVDNIMAKAREFREMMEKAREFREMMEQARANAADVARTKQLGSEAASKLDRLAVGRQALGNAAGVGAAMTSGGGLAGVGGAMLAAATGKPLGRGMLKAVDTASAIGQKLERVQPLVERFAQSDTPIGNAIRWALSADGEAMLVRLAAIADLPGAD